MTRVLASYCEPGFTVKKYLQRGYISCGRGVHGDRLPFSWYSNYFARAIQVCVKSAAIRKEFDMQTMQSRVSSQFRENIKPKLFDVYKQSFQSWFFHAIPSGNHFLRLQSYYLYQLTSLREAVCFMLSKNITLINQELTKECVAFNCKIFHIE